VRAAYSLKSSEESQCPVSRRQLRVLPKLGNLKALGLIYEIKRDTLCKLNGL